MKIPAHEIIELIGVTAFEALHSWRESAVDFADCLMEEETRYPTGPVRFADDKCQGYLVLRYSDVLGLPIG